MMHYVLYVRATGHVLAAGSCDPSHLHMLEDDNVAALEVDAPLEANGIRVVDGRVEALPPRPAPTYAWDAAAANWKDPRTLEEARAQAWDRVKVRRAQLCALGMDWMGRRIQCDPSSLAHMSAAATAAAHDGTGMWLWTDAHNTALALDPAQMVAMAAAAGRFVADIHARACAARLSIELAQTIQEVDQVEVPCPSKC